MIFEIQNGKLSVCMSESIWTILCFTTNFTVIQEFQIQRVQTT